MRDARVRRRCSATKSFLTVAVVGVGTGAPRIAAAADSALPKAEPLAADLTSETTAQFYDLRSPTGESVLARRRLTSTVSGAAYQLIREDYGELFFRARARFDADAGRGGAEVDPSNLMYFVPGFQRTGADIMYAYLEGRRFAKGWLGFRLGRQLQIGPLGFWSFDGAELKVTTPLHFAVEGFTGLEVRSGLPFSSARFERGGMWRGDRTGMDPLLYPSFEESHIAPAWGIAAESVGLETLTLQAVYRHVWNTGAYHANPFLPDVRDDGPRTSSERAGASANLVLGELAGLRTGLSYDFYAGRFDSIYGAADLYFPLGKNTERRLSAGVDVDHYAPTFDADSIWNFFAGAPADRVGLHSSLDLSERWSLSAGGGLRVLASVALPSSASSAGSVTGSVFQEDGYAHVRYREHENAYGLSANANAGAAGDRGGADVYAEHLVAGRTMLEARASAWHFRDKLRSDHDATSVGITGALGYRLSPKSRAILEEQVETNRLVGIRSRLMVWFTVAVTP